MQDQPLSSDTPDAKAKIHPASREILPDDPMQMTGVQIPGDPDLMLRLLVEEYARIGTSAEALMELARDPNFRSFHGLWLRFGEEEMQRRVDAIIARCGVMRVKVAEAEPEPVPEQLVQIEMPGS